MKLEMVGVEEGKVDRPRIVREVETDEEILPSALIPSRDLEKCSMVSLWERGHPYSTHSNSSNSISVDLTYTRVEILSSTSAYAHLILLFRLVETRYELLENASRPNDAEVHTIVGSQTS